MVAYERDLDSFFTKSAQLIQVFSTARCTTKYRKLNDSQAFITVKTYDAQSGAIVKFKTDKTVDLGRLLVGNSKISANFIGKATLENPSKSDVVDTEMADAVGASATTKLSDGQDVSLASVPTTTTTTTGGAKKKKKKGGKK